MLFALALVVLSAHPETAGPTRVVSDPRTALISPDPGNRVIDGLIANREKLDACAVGFEALIGQGAYPSVDFKFGVDGRLVSVGRPKQADVPKGLLAKLACFEKVLRALKVGTSDLPRSGTLFFRADRPFVPDADPVDDSARVEKSELGVTIAVTGHRQRAKAAGRFGIAYEATITNTGKAPRGVRQRFLYANLERTADDGRSVDNSFMANTDTTAPITCLRPGESLGTSIQVSERETIGPGGRYHSSPFVVVGDCAGPGERAWVGGFRLDWTEREDAPRIIAMPYWVHAAEPFRPRAVWR